ncbi:hypothetical protein [Streptomyces sp. NPDC051546]|uniref:hypothetical protein n=1 Tax=Streptomyces sp. NPDC051546 TaxID=3365655 RepID=UPI0037B82A4B
MDEEQQLFARASLDGEVWKDTLVHAGPCTRCLDLLDSSLEAPAGAGPGGATASGARCWMVVMSAATVIASLATVITN